MRRLLTTAVTMSMVALWMLPGTALGDCTDDERTKRPVNWSRRRGGGSDDNNAE